MDATSLAPDVNNLISITAWELSRSVVVFSRGACDSSLQPGRKRRRALLFSFNKKINNTLTLQICNLLSSAAETLSKLLHIPSDVCVYLKIKSASISVWVSEKSDRMTG